MANSQPAFQPKQIYHVFNHSVGEISLFKQNDNYKYFLQKFDKYISPIAHTYAYCLLPNHFHFLIQIVDEKALLSFFRISNPEGLGNPQGLIAKWISHQFGNLQNAYAKAFNKLHARRGSLFEESIQRRMIDNRNYFFNALRYIHFNPVHHGLVADIQDWTFTSWHSYVSYKPSKISTKEVLKNFKSLNSFQDRQRSNQGLEKYALDMELAY